MSQRKKFLKVVPGQLVEVFRRDLLKDAEQAVEDAETELDEFEYDRGYLESGMIECYPLGYEPHFEARIAWGHLCDAQRELKEIKRAIRTEEQVQADRKREEAVKMEQDRILKASALARIPVARTLQDFQDIAKDAGYSSKWAWRTWNDRKNRPAATEEDEEESNNAS